MIKLIHKPLVFLMLICSTSSFAAMINDTATQVKWGYEGKRGPTRWGNLDESFILCVAGQRQAPIDITKETVMSPNSLTIHYQSEPLNIVDNGTTELTLGDEQMIINDGHSVQVNFAQPSETITFNNHQYQLLQFHFHTPSETKLAGKSFPLEIHFVHQGDNAEAAVIAVFVQEGKENYALQKIVANLPKTEGKVESIPNVRINPSDLLPGKQTYYNFDGSLTTPPCTEGVNWLVMTGTITASAAQIAQIKAGIGMNNARPVQPLNDRKIVYSPKA